MKSSVLSYFLLGYFSLTSVAQNQIGFNPPAGCDPLETIPRASTAAKNKYCAKFQCQKQSNGKQDSTEKQCAQACPNFRSTDPNKKVSSVSCFYSGKWYPAGNRVKQLSDQDINKGGKHTTLIFSVQC